MGKVKLLLEEYLDILLQPDRYRYDGSGSPSEARQHALQGSS